VVVMGPYLPILAVSLGGILGANARYLVGVYVDERLGTAFPYGTLLINVSGSLGIGFFLTLAAERFTIDRSGASSSRPASWAPTPRSRATRLRRPS
jgi:fluoride ion exporter CrcB/FEX